MHPPNATPPAMRHRRCARITNGTITNRWNLEPQSASTIPADADLPERNNRAATAVHNSSTRSSCPLNRQTNAGSEQQQTSHLVVGLTPGHSAMKSAKD